MNGFVLFFFFCYMREIFQKSLLLKHLTLLFFGGILYILFLYLS